MDAQPLPLSADEVRHIHAYWRACNYLAAGMIYLRDNPLLQEPLKPEHLKKRLLGHWGSSPGLAFSYIHMNRLINKYDLNAIFMAGPGHGAPRTIGDKQSGTDHHLNNLGQKNYRARYIFIVWSNRVDLDIFHEKMNERQLLGCELISLTVSNWHKADVIPSNH